MAGLENYRRIENPRAYLYQVVRSILLSQVRRAKVVRFDTVAELDSLGVIDSGLDPEQAVLRKDDLQRLKSLIENLPVKIRQVFLLRKIDGLPQKAIATRLNMSERTVEWYSTQGLRLVLAEWAKTDKDVRRRLRDEERTEQRDRS
jgi:RNA polymerase sigma-70 factor (ECF subfamily)